MDVRQQLTVSGAVATDRHFVYTSGKHGSTYINLDPILPDVALMARLCRELAAPFRGRAEVVAAPAVGGIVLAVLTAQALSEGNRAVPAVWADKTAARGMAVERAGFADRLRGRAALVVEDLITTGGSVRGVCREIERLGARIIGVSAVCNRGDVTAEQLGVPRLHALATVSFAAYPPDDCPLCAEGRPVVEDVGHGGGFRDERPDYPGGFTRLLASTG